MEGCRRELNELIIQLIGSESYGTCGIGGADKSLTEPRRKQAIAIEGFDVHRSYLKIIIGGILVL